MTRHDSVQMLQRAPHTFETAPFPIQQAALLSWHRLLAQDLNYPSAPTQLLYIIIMYRLSLVNTIIPIPQDLQYIDDTSPLVNPTT